MGGFRLEGREEGLRSLQRARASPAAELNQAGRQPRIRTFSA